MSPSNKYISESSERKREKNIGQGNLTGKRQLYLSHKVTPLSVTNRKNYKVGYFALTTTLAATKLIPSKTFKNE